LLFVIVLNNQFPIPNSPFPIPHSPLPIFMIDREEVRKVANLARLELTPEEEEQFTGQLNGILDYFEQLSELDTSKVQPTTRAIDVSNVMRADDLQPFPKRESILEGSPDRDGEFFKVPKIM
jgi:aspartyl-tRNA(Asn)/glutamyl-tRNA(Gln) amidotransferase subunit C